MSSKITIKLLKQILSVEKQRKDCLKILSQEEQMIEGSYRECFVRCGRTGCHCEKKPIHLVSRISHWEDGKLINKVVRVDDRHWVKEKVEIYKKHKQALSKLTHLDD